MAAAFVPGAAQPHSQLTDDSNLNNFAAEHMDENAHMRLQGVTAELRKKALFITWTRWKAGTCRVPSSYVVGILRQETERGGPYGGGGPGGPRPTMPMHMGQPQAVMSIPTPQRGTSCTTQGQQQPGPLSAAAAERPPLWVTSAAALYTNRGALFRAISEQLQPSSLDALARLPAAFQQACVLSMLVAAPHYSCPDQYVGWFVAQVAGLQLPAQVAALQGRAQTSSEKKVVLILCGTINGNEWVTSGLAFQRAREMKVPCTLLERMHIAQPCRWEPVLDEVAQQLSPPVRFERVKPADAINMLMVKAVSWYAQGAAVIFVIAAPPPQLSGTAAQAKFPGYHASASAELWNYIAAIKAVKHHNIETGVALLTGQTTERPEDAVHLDSVFGTGWSIASSTLRVPQQTFLVRSRPCSAPPQVHVRQAVAKPSWAADLDAALDGLYSGAGDVAVQLPDLAEIETAIEKTVAKVSLADGEQRALNLVTLTSARVQHHVKLLNRAAVGSLFGVDGWNIVEHWHIKLPCATHVNMETGLATNAENAEAVPCGEPRWCRGCSEFYYSFITCPSAFLIQEVVLQLLQDMLTTPDANLVHKAVTLEELPQHVCIAPCTGLMQ